MKKMNNIIIGRNRNSLRRKTAIIGMLCTVGLTACAVDKDVPKSTQESKTSIEESSESIVATSYIELEEATESSSDTAEALYDGDELTVSGTVISRDYEINSNNKGTVYILELDEPVTRAVYSENWGYDGDEIEIKEIQIQTMANGKEASDYEGKHIDVTGNVMYGSTGHHLTLVLLMEARVL